MTDEDMLGLEWHPVPDDTVGGWAISNVNLPVSAHDYRAGHHLIGSFLTEGMARHLCQLHNATLSK